MNTIDDLLKTGRLGRLGEGMTTTEVREWLGDPEGTGGTGWPQLWKYGSLQLGYHRTSPDEMPFLVSIAVDFRSEEESPPAALSLSGWYPRHGCTYAEFRHHLDEAGINVVGGVTSGPRKHLVVGPGIRITFDADLLDSLQHTSKREPERKPFLVSARRENLDRIRTEARSLGISVTTLCSRWIDAHAEQLAEAGGLASANRRA